MVDYKQRCKQAAETQIALQGQLLANKRLDFELARLKNCGELIQKGIRFHPRSPYAKVCADVVVQNVTQIQNHTHSIPSTSSVGEQSAVPSQPDSSASAQQSSHSEDCGGIFLPLKTATFFITFFTTGFTTFNKRSARGFASSAEDVATTAIVAVVVIMPADGMF